MCSAVLKCSRCYFMSKASNIPIITRNYSQNDLFEYNSRTKTNEQDYIYTHLRYVKWVLTINTQFNNSWSVNTTTQFNNSWSVNTPTQFNNSWSVNTPTQFNNSWSVNTATQFNKSWSVNTATQFNNSWLVNTANWTYVITHFWFCHHGLSILLSCLVILYSDTNLVCVSVSRQSLVYSRYVFSSTSMRCS